MVVNDEVALSVEISRIEVLGEETAGEAARLRYA
jgi:hypothetical protein